jgi:Phasin protein
MAQTKLHTENSSLSDLIPSQFAAMGKKGFEKLIEGQTELLENFERLHRNWIDRMQSEATFASEFTTKLLTARTVPEGAAVWQEWASRRMEIAAEDTRRLFADSQKFAEEGARWLSSGSMSNGRAHSS